MKNRTPSTSRFSSFSGELREVRVGRKSMGAMVAAVEGHGGEGRAWAPCCAGQEESGSESSETEGGQN